MTLQTKLNKVKNDVLSVGIKYKDTFQEYAEDDFDNIPKELLEKSIKKTTTFDTPTYIEISME